MISAKEVVVVVSGEVADGVSDDEVTTVIDDLVYENVAYKDEAVLTKWSCLVTT